MSKYMAYAVIEKIVYTGEVNASSEDEALAKAKASAKEQGLDTTVVGVIPESEDYV